MPTIRDRVAQRALSSLLSKSYEPRFSDVSFGFRPARSAQGAVRRVMHAIAERVTPIVVEFDVRGFFDSVRHETVLDRLVRDGVDGRLVDLVAAFVRAPIVDATSTYSPTIGTPQGGPLSPLLANVVLDRWFPSATVERCWRAAQLVRFADDFVVVVDDDSVANDVLAQVSRRLDEFGLALHPDKCGKACLRASARSEHGDSFDFIGWTVRFEEHEHGRQLVRRTSLKTMRRSLQRLTREMRSDRWQLKTPAEKRDWFAAVVRGHRAYFDVPGNERQLDHFETEAESAFRRHGRVYHLL